MLIIAFTKTRKENKRLAKNLLIVEKLKQTNVSFACKAKADRQKTAPKMVDFHPQLVQVLAFTFSISRILMITWHLHVVLNITVAPI